MAVQHPNAFMPQNRMADGAGRAGHEGSLQRWCLKMANAFQLTTLVVGWMVEAA
jgi:hypothetical protein